MTAYLLDTHAAIWWWTADRRLGRSAASLIEAGAATIFVSSVSVWEISIKNHAGKLPEIIDFERQYAPLMQANGFISLPVTDEHALRAGYLAGDHRDPFDRMIAAQALMENLTVVTRDREIAELGCTVIW